MAEHFDPFLTLADDIRERFTPHSTKYPYCEHADCKDARQTDPRVWVQAETADRIARFIEANALKVAQ